MLYRIWNTALWFRNTANMGIACENVTIHGKYVPAVPYVRDYYGSVWFLDNDSNNEKYISYISSKAKRNEAGIYVPSGIPSGKYVVSYVFKLNPDVLYDGSHYLIPLVLATEHHFYNGVKITMPDNFKVYVFPPTLKIHTHGRSTTISGTLEEDFPLKTYMVMRTINNFTHSSINSVDYDLERKASSDMLLEHIRYWIAWSTTYVLLYAIMILPFVYLATYLIKGRERKKYAIPREVIEPPTRRPPRVVNIVFKKEGDGVDLYSIFMATLLVLHKKGKIKIYDNGEKIEILEYDDDLDPFERKVMNYLLMLSEDDKVDLKNIKEKLVTARKHSDTQTLIKYEGLSNELIITPDEKDKILKKYITTPSKRIEMLFTFGILWGVFGFVYVFIFARDIAIYAIIAMFLPLLYITQVGLMWWHPEVLGRWKEDYYKEKLMWDRFKEFLKNEKLLKEKYAAASEFLDDWLIYGYALGVHSKVLKALKRENLDFPLLNLTNNLLPYVVYITPGSVGGVTGGAMGGFGGGGGGAR